MNKHTWIWTRSRPVAYQVALPLYTVSYWSLNDILCGCECWGCSGCNIQATCDLGDFGLSPRVVWMKLVCKGWIDEKNSSLWKVTSNALQWARRFLLSSSCLVKNNTQYSLASLSLLPPTSWKHSIYGEVIYQVQRSISNVHEHWTCRQKVDKIK